MLERIIIKQIDAMPFLSTSALAKTHLNGIALSDSKINVIVGPNGTGKSALLEALAIKTLSFFTGKSLLDGKYISGSKAREFWSKQDWWKGPLEFFPGLDIVGPPMRSFYYRPSHIPGDCNSAVEAMMCGYFDEGKKYASLTEDKSSGEQALAVLHSLFDKMSDKKKNSDFSNWSWSKIYDENLRRNSGNDSEIKANLLKEKYFAVTPKAAKLVLLDEPEQSLDGLQEALFWEQLLKSNFRQFQFLVASHSWYPFIFPEKFHLIETVPGHVEKVKALLN